MKTTIAILVWLGSLSCYGQAAGNETVDRIFSDWDQSQAPGAAVGIVRDGKLIIAKGYGLADLEHDIPITPSTRFFLGSVSKQFTAFCILLLEEQGKLNLNDEIQNYLPDFPRYHAPITINHLIHHTSGIRDLFTLFWLQGRNYLDHISEKDAYDILKHQQALNCSPGEKYLYSNSNYFLLGKIVKAASTTSLKEFARQHIFEPLGMYNTLYLDDNGEIVKNRAFGYGKTEGKDGFRNIIRRYDLVGSAGIYSTIEDLYRWDQNFYHNTLGKGGQRIIDKMHEEIPLNNGMRNNYAFGIGNGTYKGLRRVDHTGSHGGYVATIDRFPDHGFSVIILSNRSEAVRTKALAIADNFLKSSLSPIDNTSEKSSASRFIKMTAEELKKYAGHYLNDQELSVREVFVSNDTLKATSASGSPMALLPIKKNEFMVLPQGANVLFARFDEKNNMIFCEGNRILSQRRKYTSREYSPKELYQFEGTYYNSEIDTEYQLLITGDKLMLRIGTLDDTPMYSIATNILGNTQYGVFDFETNAAGKVSRLKITSGGGVQRLAFVRK